MQVGQTTTVVVLELVGAEAEIIVPLPNGAVLVVPEPATPVTEVELLETVVVPFEPETVAFKTHSASPAVGEDSEQRASVLTPIGGVPANLYTAVSIRELWQGYGDIDGDSLKQLTLEVLTRHCSCQVLVLSLGSG